MTEKSELVARPPHDLGGLREGPLVRSEHDMTPFEKSCHALLNVLNVHKLVNTEEKRRGVEDLGSEMIGKLTYYERWAVSASKVLIEKKIITSEELGKKMAEIKARLGEDA
ncbi:nitrile hydratase subunit beta [Amycolatopsis carbonis]|uniref:Nitrile hydratase subunit beta n=1 Tax=Amycolatopsis carbonis TaxID=715471 RepID=A0A9Y2N1Z5_9PSEU|nr:SH3-like domain-containing protein [Amycolatopsis sp. 2-15]WIX83502.1 nitrile hydratase subunit beta [Amycolatopsis sp. 2-15]